MDAESIAYVLGGKPSGSGFMCRCPAHDDKHPSFSVKDVEGRTLVHCFGGCSQASVIDALRSLGLWHSESKHTAITRQRTAEIERAKLIIKLARSDVNRNAFNPADLPTVEKAKTTLEKYYGR